MKSPLLNNRLFNFNKSETGNILLKQEEDNTLSELKPVKFEGLYKKEMTAEEITNEIQKLLQDCLNVPQNNENKTNTKMNRQNVITNNIADYSYPFKQDKITCTIF